MANMAGNIPGYGGFVGGAQGYGAGVNANAIAFNEDAFISFIRNSTETANETVNLTMKELVDNFTQLSQAWYGKIAGQTMTTSMRGFSSALSNFAHSAEGTINRAISAGCNMAAAAGQTLGGIGNVGIPAEFGDAFFSGESSTGVVGIVSLSSFSDSVTKFKQIKNSFEGRISSYLSAVSNTGFIDAGTEEAIRSEVTAVKNSMVNTFDSLITKLEQELNSSRETLESTRNSNTAMFQ